MEAMLEEREKRGQFEDKDMGFSGAYLHCFMKEDNDVFSWQHSEFA